MIVNSNFQRLLTAYLLSAIGDWLYRLALPLFLFQQTKSPLIMAIAYGLTFLPFILVTPFGGVLADRVKRQNMLIVGDSLAFILTLLLAIFINYASHSLVIIYLLVFFIASLTSLCHPAFQGFITVIVKQENLAQANSYISSSDNIILLLGPICSGTVIAWLGTINAVYINAFSFLVSAILNSTITPYTVEMVKNSKLGISNIISDLIEGFTYAISNPIIKFGCILFIFINFGIQVFYANFMYYLINYLHLNPNKVGLTLAITGIGAILGSMIAPKLIKKFSEGRIILISCISAGVAVLTLLFAHNYWAVGFGWGLESIFSSIIVVTYFTLRQHVVPNQFLGRTVAITRLISYLAIPIASITGGFILQHTQDINYLILLGGSVMVFTGILGFATPLNVKKQSIYIKD